jgi:hypothetical protein
MNILEAHVRFHRVGKVTLFSKSKPAGVVESVAPKIDEVIENGNMDTPVILVIEKISK